MLGHHRSVQTTSVHVKQSQRQREETVGILHFRKGMHGVVDSLWFGENDERQMFQIGKVKYGNPQLTTTDFLNLMLLERYIYLSLSVICLAIAYMIL